MLLIIFLFYFRRPFADHSKHLCLEGFFVLIQSILFPSEVSDFDVKVILSHSTFKHTDDVSIVGLLVKLERPTVLHVLLKLRRSSFAQLL